MKLLITCAYLFFGSCFSPAEVSDEVIVALKQGRYVDLVKFFDEKVSVKLMDQEDVLSRSQAEANLKYFFEKHPVRAFSSSRSSSVNNNVQYITGTLETSNGRFHVSVLLRRNLIAQFRIENDNE